MHEKSGVVMLISENALLLIIDVQKAFDVPCRGKRNNLFAEENIESLLTLWRKTKRPIIFIQHVSKDPNSLFHSSHPGFAIKESVAPKQAEPIIIKKENSAFIGTDLEQRLKNDYPKPIQHIVVVGLTTDHCVSTTTRMGANLGFTMAIVIDATATFDRIDHLGKLHLANDMHDTNLASLHNEFATVMTTQEVLGDANVNYLILREYLI
jgi:nicotinamidase-related amidase